MLLLVSFAMMFAVGYYNQDDRSGPRRDSSRRDFGKRSFGGNRGPVEMHQAVCSSCGKSCEVPFRPNGSRPVYCNDCFKKTGNAPDSGRFQDREQRRPDFERRNDAKPPDSQQLDVINRKLDKILELLTTSLVYAKPTTQVQPIATPIVVPEKKTRKKTSPIKE